MGQGLIRRWGLRTGDEIEGEADAPAGRGRSLSLGRVSLVNGRPPEAILRRPEFNRLSAVHPTGRLVLEHRSRSDGRYGATNRAIDLFCPLGKGQRALIVSPAKAGKTTVLQAIAEGIAANHPKIGRAHV